MRRDLMLTDLAAFADTLPATEVELLGMPVRVLGRAEERDALNCVFGRQCIIRQTSNALNIWTVASICSDRFFAAFLEHWQLGEGDTSIKRWGGDVPAIRREIGEHVFIISHTAPFIGLTVFSEANRFACYIRPETASLNVPHFEHLVKYILRTQCWRAGFVEVHAAACLLHGKCFLIMGQRKAGKTTLATHLLSLGGLMVSSDFGLIRSQEQRWSIQAVPHMCRIGPGTVHDSPFLHPRISAFSSNTDYLKGPVFYDQKYELYAGAMDVIFGRSVNAAEATIDGILFPSFSIDTKGASFSDLSVAHSRQLVEDRLINDKPLPDWLPFLEVKNRLELEQPSIAALLFNIPPTAILSFGPTSTLDIRHLESRILDIAGS